MERWHKVRTVNPRGEKKGKGKVAKKKGGKKKSSSSHRSHGKRGGKKRGHNPKRGGHRRGGGRRRGHNPSYAGIDPIAPFKSGEVGFRIVGKLAGAFAVMRFGDKGTSGSETVGMRWTIKNHLINLLGGFLAGVVVSKVVSPHRGQQVYDGAADLSVSKAFWHELVHAIPGGSKYFGNRPMGQIPQQLIALAQPGDMLDDGKGNRFLVQVGNDGTKRLVPMMGLERERPLDGLERERALDGLEAARDLDGYEGRKRRGEAMGHLSQGWEDEDAAYDAASWRRGTNDPYAAQFTGG